MPARVAAPSGQVTFVFTDIEGSTRLARVLGDRYQALLTAHRRVLRAHLTVHGVELFTEGDSFFLAFAGAREAIDGCLAAQRALYRCDWPAGARPRVRMGLHTGYAVPTAGEYASPEVHRAARVASAAHGGQVLCSAATAREAGALPADVEVRDLGLHRLRGFDGRTRLLQLTCPGVDRDFPRPRTSGVVRHNLPAPVTPFVGRERERADLRALLQAHRLVTVVGAPGVGKTRLAVRVAAGQTERFADGVWYVDLAGLAPAAVPAAVAAGLGVRLETGRGLPPRMAEITTAHDVLLVLDTCEVAPDVLAQVATQLLAGCGDTRLLVIGRQPLGVPGECVWRTPPMGFQPGPGGEPSDALTLLRRRAEAARGGRAVERAELPVLQEVAAGLEGLPLALELAAAQLRCVPVADLPARLDELVGAAGPEPVEPAAGGAAAGRMTSLAESVGWSYRRLPGRAARLLRALSVFAGPVPAEAIRWVIQEDPLEPLATLVDVSLVEAVPDPAGVRYQLLRPVRAYAARRLAGAGEEAAARGRHARWVARELALQHVAEDGRPATWALSAIDPLRGEIDDALAWTVAAGDPWQALRLVRALDAWWIERGATARARAWLCRLYGRLGGPDPLTDATPPGQGPLLVELFLLHSRLAAAAADAPAAAVFAGRARRLARSLDDPGLCLLVDAWAPVEATEDGYRDVLRRAAALRMAGDALPAVHGLGTLLWQRGAWSELVDLLVGARPVEASRPAVRGRRTIDAALGLTALARDDLVSAHHHLSGALRAQVAFGFELAACNTIAGVAVRCAATGDGLTAARLFGAADANRAARSAVADVAAPFFAQREERARALGGPAFDAAYAQGATWSLAEAAEVALAIPAPSPAEGRRCRTPNAVARR
ncbi:hypothetical protein GCM10010123_22030 [Pilimelia anulata]|uniref:Guanylate cyclase domain-containing protein n=1 Tax=Pilimelia anulata TaxID=53371 RepID=A0A8J3B6L0_9ACTN|nr:adenylate/guanylate cyclase domain-containing protein [Pilimelia anulata]GGJ91808.1 hypothetical protein GCM10010123_22030 [Pilimelia anulata]